MRREQSVHVAKQRLRLIDSGELDLDFHADRLGAKYLLGAAQHVQRRALRINL